MSKAPSIADDLAEASRLIRSPMATDAAGELTATGRAGADRLEAILANLSNARAETADDALALAQLAWSLMGVVASNVEANHAARISIGPMAAVVDRLRGCLAGMSGRNPEEFEILRLPGRPALH